MIQAESRIYPTSTTNKMSRLPVFSLPIPLYLSLKEIWRNKGRYALISAVVALITTLVLFIAGLTEGLGRGNREYIENLDADLLLYQQNVDTLISASRFSRTTVKKIRRVEGVQAAGAVAFSNVSIALDTPNEFLKVSLVGVEPGQPGEPAVNRGKGLVNKSANEVIIDQNVLIQAGFDVGDRITVKSTIGTDEEFYELEVVGVTDSQKYFIQPSIIVPYQTWGKVRPRSPDDDPDNVIFNVAAVKLDDPSAIETMDTILESSISDVDAVDIVTAYEATPGYSAQQSTLDTQRYFTLIIGILVIGGFFQIQTLQKVSQVGMLKAIGASSLTIIIAAVLQIISINFIGVVLGAVGTLSLGLILPPGIPIIFEGTAVSGAIISLLLIGPVGGLVSLRALLKAEPLTALGLSS